MTTTVEPPGIAPPPTIRTQTSTPTLAASTVGEVGSTPTPRGSKTPRVDRWLMPALYAVGALAGTLVGVIGFAASYSTLEAAARDWGFGRLSPAFPVGVDASIIAFLVLDLVLIHRRTPWPVLRLAAHAMTGVTIVLNASAQKGGISFSSRTLSHAVMPVLFVIGVEAARRLVVRAARLAAGQDTEGVPAYRWFLAPLPTFKLWRRMKLWRLHSYSRAVKLEQARTIYAVRLEQKYGKKWRTTAKPEELLPLTLAPYGLTVDEALMIPEQERRAEADRQHAAKEREDKAAAEELERQTRAKRQAAAARISAMEADTEVTEAAAALQARTATAEVKAGADVASAEAVAAAQTEAARQAAATEAAALESASVLAAKQQEAVAEKAAADEAKAAADAKRAAVDAKREADDAARRAADYRLRTAEINAAAAVKEKEIADAAKAAADAKRAAADAKREADDAENAALDAEALLKLQPTERAARYIARIVIGQYGGDAEQMSVEAVADALGGASHGTAVKRRQEAADLVAAGYTG
ncbi:DUF2637 domain-containing protein [Streptomyces sp. NPDC024089]|uniref:DUF2637 domain-containing protein n=1 Tax=Streptomyces sp. NPDC024089 TaxID=3154328 RepID=UPI0033EF371B